MTCECCEREIENPDSNLTSALDQHLNYLIPVNSLNFLDNKLCKSKVMVNKL